MAQSEPLNILCVAAALQGRPFIQEANKLGHNVYLLTSEKLLKEKWIREDLKDIFAVPKLFDERMVRNVVSYLNRDIKFHRIVPVGDWEMEMCAYLREHLRVPGMGETTMRYFRDKLAMRMKTEEDGIPIPSYTPLFNWKEIHEYIDRVPPPWILKSRQEAASMGIQKVNSRDELWPKLDQLGDKMSLTLMEKFLPGDLYHVDSVIHDDGEVAFAGVSRYGTPMLQLTKEGGVFTSMLIDRESDDHEKLQEINKKVVKSLGLRRGVTHIEYIKAEEDGKFYFLEAGARVGAARIPDVLWHASGICLWHEWARIEINKGPSKLATPREDYAGVALSISKYKEPDLSTFDDPEICYRQARDHKAGLIVKSPDPGRVEELVAKYAQRFQTEFMAHNPTPEGQ